MNFNFDFLSQIDWTSPLTWIPLLVGLIGGWLIEWLIDIFYFRNKNSRLKTENIEIGRQLDTMTSERDRHKQFTQSAEDRLKLAEADAATLRDDLEAVTMERNQVQSELSLANKRVADLSNSENDIPELRRRAEQAETKLRALEGDLTTQQTQTQKLTEEMETLQFQRNQLEERLKAAQTKLGGAAAAVPAAATVDTGLQDRLAEAESKLAAVEAERTDLMQRLTSAETELTQLQTGGADTTKLQDRLTATESELMRLSDENDRIRSELDIAQAAESKLSEIEVERSTLLQRLSDADAEIDQLRSSASSMTAGAAGAVAGGVGGALLGNSERDKLMQQLEETETERITEYNRRVEAEMRIGELENSLNEQRLQAQHLEEKVSVLETTVQPEDDTLQVQLDAANSRIAALQGEVDELRKREVVPTASEEIGDEVADALPVGGDDFLKIDGVGHVFARRLHESGVNTFEALSQLAPAEIERIVQPQSWQIVDAADWIRQANGLIGGQA